MGDFLLWNLGFFFEGNLRFEKMKGKKKEKEKKKEKKNT